jgi:hypothetical protein
MRKGYMMDLIIIITFQLSQHCNHSLWKEVRKYSSSLGSKTCEFKVKVLQFNLEIAELS